MNHLFKILIFLLPVFTYAQKREKISLDSGWFFSKDSLDNGVSSHQSLNWEKINLPHTYNVKDVMDDQPGYYRGISWYKKKIKLKEEWKNKEIYLCFDGVNQESKVFINGSKIGEHIGGYNQFRHRITSLLNDDFIKNHEIAVEVNNRFNPDIPPLTADFTFFGGIYRHVYLLVVDRVHFNDENYGSDGVEISSPKISSKNATVNIKGQFVNHSNSIKKLQIATILKDKTGEKIAEVKSFIDSKVNETTNFNQAINHVPNPKLWSPENPYLYNLTTSITDFKTQKVLDIIHTKYGFRWFSFDADSGFYLNGKPYKLIGASRHQDYKNLGNALPDSIQQKDVLLLKQMGANFLRVAHYPQSPVILKACDSLGLLASVEIPVVNQISETEAFYQNAEQMQLEMIKQNFNHPSIIIWAYMNEVLLRMPFSNDKNRQDIYLKHVEELAQKLDDLTKKTDSSRYTMIANHGSFDLYERAGLIKIPQVVGWNLYQGWYGGKIEDFAKQLDQIHSKQPNKPMLITEFGADADPRIRTLTPEKFDKSVEYALDYHQFYIKAIEERPFIAGGAIWNLADFNSETREETMPHINNKGLLTWDRKRKDTYTFYQAHLSKKPYIKISNWVSRAGQADSTNNYSKQPLAIFSNADSVELFHQQKSLGKKAVINNSAIFNVPFVNGINDLKTYNSTQKIADASLIDFQLIPSNLKTQALSDKGLNILLGAKRYYIEPENKTVWIPAQAYQKNSWGYIGGKSYQLPNLNRQSYGTDRNIENTDDDPIYQTQQVGVKSFKLDLPDGNYQLKLYFAEFLSNQEKEALAYNLDDSKQNIKASKRIFNVAINQKTVLDNFDIAKEYGSLKAVAKTFNIEVKNNQGIDVSFQSVDGEAILNAIQVKAIK